jgi:hypothetical protein
VAALALAALGLASTAASAATVSPGANDLVLGFQLAGNNTDLEVDLGPSSQFTTTATLTLSQLSVADLTAIYGSNWASTALGTGVNWSIAGLTSQSSTDNTFEATSINTTAPKSGTSTTLATPEGAISSLATGSFAAGSLNGATATANSSSSAAIGGVVNATNPAGTSASGLSQSYQSLEGGNGYTFVPNAEQTGAGTDNLFLFAAGVKNSPSTELGTFSLSSAGVLTYNGTAAAVPEPSAYALGICAALLFWVLKRRKSVA